MTRPQVSIFLSKACWEAAQPTVDTADGAIGIEARLLLGAGLMQIFHVMPKEHQPRLLEELVTSSISRLSSASQTVSTLESKDISPLQTQKMSSDIMLLSGLLKEFTLATSKEDNMEDDEKALGQHSMTDVVMTPHVVSIIRSALPSVLYLTKRFLHDEVSLRSIIVSYFIVSSQRRLCR